MDDEWQQPSNDWHREDTSDWHRKDWHREDSSRWGDGGQGGSSWSGADDWNEGQWDNKGSGGKGSGGKGSEGHWYGSAAWKGKSNKKSKEEEAQKDLRIELADRQLADAGIQQWLTREGPQVLYELKRSGGSFDSVDVSSNQITDTGCAALVKWLMDSRVPVRRLKLFKNQLKAGCSTAICKLIEDKDLGIGNVSGLQELHLSSNNITVEGIKSILDSICLRKKLVQDKFNPPIWLRLERNGLDRDAAKTLAEAYVAKGITICLEGGATNSACSIRSCSSGADVHVHVTGGNKSHTGRRGW